MVPDLSQQPDDASFDADQAHCRAEVLLFAGLDVGVGEFGHPFEQHSADYEGYVDADDADYQFDALLLVYPIEETHF